MLGRPAYIPLASVGEAHVSTRLISIDRVKLRGDDVVALAVHRDVGYRLMMIVTCAGQFSDDNASCLHIYIRKMISPWK